MINIIHGNIGKDGTEEITICTGKNCCISEQGWCEGEYVCFENNHKKQTVTITRGKHYPFTMVEIDKVKDEVWTENECLLYLQKKGIPLNHEVCCKRKEEKESDSTFKGEIR